MIDRPLIPEQFEVKEARMWIHFLGKGGFSALEIGNVIMALEDNPGELTNSSMAPKLKEALNMFAKIDNDITLNPQSLFGLEDLKRLRRFYIKRNGESELSEAEGVLMEQRLFVLRKDIAFYLNCELAKKISHHENFEDPFREVQTLKKEREALRGRLHTAVQTLNIFKGIGGLALGAAIGVVMTGVADQVTGRGLLDQVRQRWADSSLRVPSEEVRLSDKRLDRMKIPKDLIGDFALLLYVSEPNWDPIQGTYIDTLVDPFAVAEKVLGGQFMLSRIDESRVLARSRVYEFMIPSNLSGQQLPQRNRGFDANENEKMITVRLADALNRLTDAQKLSDALLIQLLEWNYKVAYGVVLETDKIRIKRNQNQSIQDVFYDGSQVVFPFKKAVEMNQLPILSRTPRITYKALPRQIKGSTGHLLLYTGIGQPFRVPESYLRSGGDFPLSLKGKSGASYGAMDISLEEVAKTIRRYFNVRDKGKNEGNKGWTRFVDFEDGLVKKMVAHIVKGAQNDTERFEHVLDYLQIIPYQSETPEVEANRPAIFTHLQGWGDCSNRSVNRAAVLKAAGYRVALVLAGNDPLYTGKRPVNPYELHAFLAVHKDDLPLQYRTGRLPWGYGEPREWILMETGENSALVDDPIEGFKLLEIVEVL